MTSQFLAFSRKQKLQKHIANLNELIRSMTKMLERIIDERIEIACDLEPELWPVMVDSAQIEQVILNLAVNARDAMPEGGRLTLSTRNQAVREFAQIILSEAGYAVVLAEDGDSALRILQEQADPVELVLSDVVMPGLGIREFVEAVTQILPRERIVFMSGYIDEPDFVKCLKKKDTPLLAKPFSRSLLLDTVRQTLDSGRAEATRQTPE